MDLPEIISKKVLSRYARWIAEEDMLKIGLSINLIFNFPPVGKSVVIYL